jgi:hypothetical protein
MLFNVPQYIDVEDKIAGPLTAKQLLWMFGCGAALLVLWTILDKGAFFLAAIPIVFVFAAFAFYRPYGQPLLNFVGSGILFIFRPKIYSWRRIPGSYKKPARKREEIVAAKQEKIFPQEKDIIGLAKMLDTEGKERNEKIMKIIKQKQLH